MTEEGGTGTDLKGFVLKFGLLIHQWASESLRGLGTNASPLSVGSHKKFISS